MILHSYNQSGDGKLIVFVFENAVLDQTNIDHGLAIYTIEPSNSYSTHLHVEQRVNHKKKLREFTNQLNERDRKRRWRK